MRCIFDYPSSFIRPSGEIELVNAFLCCIIFCYSLSVIFSSIEGSGAIRPKHAIDFYICVLKSSFALTTSINLSIACWAPFLCHSRVPVCLILTFSNPFLSSTSFCDKICKEGLINGTMHVILNIARNSLDPTH